MYSTCLFCTRPLGRNEALEHFPVGRRLAYDPAKGRLWVVCGRCERWNLSPLETRWEAIEDADRAFRKSTLRVTTDNVGLAQLSEGLELVRLGSPPRPELAAWRYGDQFGRRRRRHIALGATAAVGLLTPGVAALGVAVGLGLLGTGVGLTYQATMFFRHWSYTTRVKMLVRDATGAPLLLTHQNVRCAALVPTGSDGNWYLKFQHRRTPSNRPIREQRTTSALTSPNSGETTFTGGAAQRALATMLPHLNRGGGSVRQVRAAAEVVGASASLHHLLRIASTNDEAKKTHFKIKDGESNVGALPPRIRLALEMALHEEDERRAMEGELHELEERWREAEEIAAIADALLLPADIEGAMAALGRRTGDGGP